MEAGQIQRKCSRAESRIMPRIIAITMPFEQPHPSLFISLSSLSLFPHFRFIGKVAEVFGNLTAVRNYGGADATSLRGRIPVS